MDRRELAFWSRLATTSRLKRQRLLLEVALVSASSKDVAKEVIKTLHEIDATLMQVSGNDETRKSQIERNWNNLSAMFKKKKR